MKLKKAFTLIELMIVVVIIWIWLLWVIAAITNSYKFLYTTKNKITAINIARWGMESVFNIRNTNWQRWWGKKDQCWLKADPLVDNWNNGCEDDPWFGSESYVLQLTWNWQKYFTLVKKTTPLKLEGILIPNDWDYLVCKDSAWIVSVCNPSPVSRPTDYFDSTLYFQQVRGGYLNDKFNNSNISCSAWDVSWCWDGRALEKNFCVDVVYFDWTKKKVSFCSLLTNFKK